MQRILIIFTFLIALLPMARGQERITTEACDFWVMFLPNGGTERPQTLELTAVGENACMVTVNNPLTGWNQTASMDAGSSVSVTLPDAAVPDSYYSADSCAFHVTSTEPISLVASFTQLASSGATLVMPTLSLGTRYVVLDYPADPQRFDLTGAVVGFVAIDTTNLTMTLPCGIPGYESGSILTIMLMPGQSYVLYTHAPLQSFSGMEVIGDHPFAMFQGNQVTCVPHYATESGDYVYEQAVSLEQWDSDYAVVASSNRTVGDRIRKLDPVVTTSGDTLYTPIETSLPSNSTFHIQGDNPFCVALCTRGSAWNGEFGDASMTMIPPMNSGVNHAGFVAYATDRINTFYLNIITRTEFVDDMMLDNSSIASHFLSLSQEDTVYSYARLAVSEGVHFLNNNVGEFVAWIYGVGRVEEYSYAVGRSFFHHQLFENDTVDYYDTVCVGHAYSGYGFDIDTITTSHDSTVIIWRSEMDRVIIHHYCLHLTVLPNVIKDTTIVITMGQTLYFLGEALTVSDTYVFHLTAANGCDSVLTIHLLYENPSATANATSICIGETVTLTAVGLVSPYWTSSPIDASLETQQGQTTVVVSPRQTTTYTLYTSNGGEPVDTIVINVYTIPELCVELSPSVVDYDNPTISFSECTDDHAVSTWTFSDGTTDVGQSVRHQFDNLSSDRVGVTLQRCNGDYCCSDTTFFLSVVRHSLWFPNAFTPDEATNNLFGCKVSFEMVYFKLNIYTRQGLLIFSTDDPNATWDGTYQGNPMPQDSYVYYWYVYDGHDYRKDGIGTVTLLR